MTLCSQLLPGRGTHLSGQKNPIPFVPSPLPTLALGIKAVYREYVLLNSPKHKVLRGHKYPQEGEGPCSGLVLPLVGYIWDAVLVSLLIHRSKLHFLISAHLAIKGANFISHLPCSFS